MTISSHLRGWHCFRAFRGFPPPGGKQVPGGLKVWLLHVAEYLLAQCLVVFRVVRFTVVDNSDFSPHRLTVSIDSPYPSFIRKLSILPISSSEDRYGLSGVRVPARVLPPPRLGAPLAPLLAPSSAFPLKSRGHTHHGPTSSQATHSA